MRATGTRVKLVALANLLRLGAAFVHQQYGLFTRESGQDFCQNTLSAATAPTVGTTGTALEEERARQKRFLFGILNPEPTKDEVLADPATKEAIVLKPIMSAIFGTAGSLPGRRNTRRITYEMQAQGSMDMYTGSSDTYLNLLEPVVVASDEQDPNGGDSTNDNGGADKRRQEQQEKQARWIRNLLSPLIPPPLRSVLATAGVLVAEDYVPMRDLFTSPTVSYAYERGWRQGFRQAGFPGSDEEAAMAMEYFAPSMARSMETRVLVDMSCATGLFTRRFAKSGKYLRVIGGDYSEAMLLEARRRIQADRDLTPTAISQNESTNTNTRLDLVRLDVGRIPMQDNSVDALHAGAAMHCWPDLTAAASEIYRVLKPGGRYFATTFLSDYFRIVSASEGGSTGPSRQAFQYFASVDQISKIMQGGGFNPENINIEVLAPSCVVIRCEK